MTRFDEYVDRKLHELHYKYGEYREDTPAISWFMALVGVATLAIPLVEILIISITGKIAAVIFLILDIVMLCTKKVSISIKKKTHPSTFMVALSIYACVYALFQKYLWFNL